MNDGREMPTLAGAASRAPTKPMLDIATAVKLSKVVGALLAAPGFGEACESKET